MASWENKDPTQTREGLLILANFSMAGNHYRQMFDYMKSLIQIVSPAEDLSDLERNFFCSACKFLVDSHLNIWRHLSIKAPNLSSSGTLRAASKAYAERIADQISKTCDEIVHFIDRHVLTTGYEMVAAPMSAESRVFYHKMKGDYLGLSVEVKKGLERLDAARTALEAYNSAMEVALLFLPPANPIRLEMALRLAEFHAVTCESVIMAYSIASRAADMANHVLEVTGETCAETTQLLELLQIKIDTWAAKLAGCSEGDNAVLRS